MYIFLTITILLAMFMFRHQIVNLFKRGETLTNSISDRVEIFCQEMDTTTLHNYKKLIEKGNIQPNARKELHRLMEESSSKSE